MGASPSTSKVTSAAPHSLPPSGHSHTSRSNQSPTQPLSKTTCPPLNTTPPIERGGNVVHNPLSPRGGGNSLCSPILSASPPDPIDGGRDSSSNWGALRDRVLERRQLHSQQHPQKSSSMSAFDPSSRARNPSSTRSEGRSLNNLTHNGIGNGIQILEWSMTFGPTEECFNRTYAEGSTLAVSPSALDGLTLVQQQERLALGLKGLPKPGYRLRGSLFKAATPRGPALGVHDAFKPLNIPEVQLAYRRLVRGVTGRGQREGSRVTISSTTTGSPHQKQQHHSSFARSSSSTAAFENPLSSHQQQSYDTTTRIDIHYHQDQQVRRSRKRSSCDNPLVHTRRCSLSMSSVCTSPSTSSLSTSVSSVDTLDSLPEEKEVPQCKMGVSDLILTGREDGESSGGSHSWVSASAGKGGLDPQSTHMVGGEFTSDDALNNKDTADFFADVTTKDGHGDDCHINVWTSSSSNLPTPPPTNGENGYVSNHTKRYFSNVVEEEGGGGTGGDSQRISPSSRGSQSTPSRISVVAFTNNNNTPAPTTTTRLPVVSILDDGLPPRPPSDSQHKCTNDSVSPDHLRACSHRASFESSCSMQTQMSGATPPTAIRGIGRKMSVSRTSSFPSGALSNSYMMSKNNLGNPAQSDTHQYHRGSSSFEGGAGHYYSSARTNSSTATSSANYQQISNSNGLESLMVVWPDISPSLTCHTFSHNQNTIAHSDRDPLLINVSWNDNEAVQPPPLFRPTPPASRRPAESSPPRFDNDNHTTAVNAPHPLS